MLGISALSWLSEFISEIRSEASEKKPTLITVMVQKIKLMRPSSLL
jgi:hypothetical protein